LSRLLQLGRAHPDVFPVQSRPQTNTPTPPKSVPDLGMQHASVAPISSHPSFISLEMAIQYQVYFTSNTISRQVYSDWSAWRSLDAVGPRSQCRCMHYSLCDDVVECFKTCICYTVILSLRHRIIWRVTSAVREMGRAVPPGA
jgi:hypothetical protein